MKIEVCQRLMDYWLDDQGKEHPKFHAQVKGRPGVWACGRNPQEAIGDLIMSHPDVFDIQSLMLTEKLPR